MPAPAEAARLVLENVTVGYGSDDAVAALSFQVPHGAQVAIVGPNGAGKSTLFKALVGLLPIHSGRVLVHDLALADHQDSVAYVPQREEVDWRFPVTVADVVMMGRFGRQGWLRPPSRADREVVLGALAALGIAHLAGHPIGELSGGQQQRVFLARALAQEPHILLMDEPFTGVDVTTRQATLALLNDLRHHDVTVLVSTHDLTLAAQRFELVLLINRRLIAYGSPQEVLIPRYIAQAFGSKALLLEDMVIVDGCCPPYEDPGSADG